MSARRERTTPGPRTAGLVLAPTGATIAWAAPAPLREHAPLPPLAGEAWPALEQALRSWRTRAGDAPLSLHVALLEPFAELRTVAIPPVDTDDARRLLARAAARHFLAATEPLAIGVAPPPVIGSAAAGATAGGTDAARLAAAAPRRVLRALDDAARGAGCTVRLVVPAGAVPMPPPSVARDGAHGVLRAHEAVLELTGWHGDRPVSLRRFRADDEPSALVAAGRGVRGPIAFVTDAATRARLAPVLAAAGVPVHEAAGNAAHGDDADPAHVLARRLASWPAAGTGSDAVPLALHTEPPGDSALASGAGRGRRMAAALLLVLAAGGVHRVGLLRELDAVRAERAALTPTLTALGLRDGDPQAAWRALAEAAARDVRWSDVLGALATTLPTDAYLLAVRAQGDTLTLEGVTRSASATFAALERAPRFRDVTATGPVRRERAPDGSSTERFAFRVRVEGGEP